MEWTVAGPYETGVWVTTYIWKTVEEFMWDVDFMKAYAQELVIDTSMCGVILYLMYRGEIHGKYSSAEVGILRIRCLIVVRGEPNQNNAVLAGTNATALRDNNRHNIEIITIIRVTKTFLIRQDNGIEYNFDVLNR